MTKLIIAFSGKIGTGKNYILESIVFNYFRKNNKNVSIIAFADFLKITCCIKDKILYERLFYDKDTVSRRTLQERGSSERQIDENIFINAMECQIKLAFDRKTDVILIPDLRFKNEFEFLKKLNAFTVRINAPKRNMDKLLKECDNNQNIASIYSSHISETNLDDCKDFKYYFNNDYSNKDNIEKEIINMLNKLN